ncbi:MULTISPECIES: SMI1/KNR4 family protein [Sphingomonas]|jgi:hypothetical protein|uniref:SMI1/KNR4 family protein n=1 Tax=Sphingomonas zeae TaxID=1646122 RepID=A0A7Y6B919_9SPHN|nr:MULTISPECIES: SMI1/KNR4 family protein [Sphingomonas]MBB4046612.1 hypothetical protein [Sphingomonas zeae]MDK8184390.1 SMI1/KNR4 family protein [Sphingomonas zeae]MDK8214521.1 SMI1/KNR4 family protein [Sphingomonas sp. UMB7805-LC452B]NUU48722.1 SMI1/KNR4 family protein [Sphingomonas zeae]
MISWLKTILSRTRPVSRTRGRPPILPEGAAEQRYAALADHWALAEPKFYTPAHDEDGITALEMRYGIRLPPEFRAYLSIAAPRHQFMDNETISWWSVRDIKSLAEECASWEPGWGGDAVEAEQHGYLVFADYLIWCWAWAICCVEGPHYGRIAVIRGSPPDTFVADDLSAFIGMALHDDPRIH